MVEIGGASSFRIGFSDLWTYHVEDAHTRLPLDQLSLKDCGHIHGRLELWVGEKLLPYLGYFGPDDVCFNSWLCQLRAALKQLQTAERSSYIFDEGEQGQPAFLFEREDTELYISIVDSIISDGLAHPEWQRIECHFPDFASSTEEFLKSFRSTLDREAPELARAWWKAVLRESL